MQHANPLIIKYIYIANEKSVLRDLTSCVRYLPTLGFLSRLKRARACTDAALSALAYELKEARGRRRPKKSRGRGARRRERYITRSLSLSLALPAGWREREGAGPRASRRFVGARGWTPVGDNWAFRHPSACTLYVPAHRHRPGCTSAALQERCMHACTSLSLSLSLCSFLLSFARTRFDSVCSCMYMYIQRVVLRSLFVIVPGGIVCFQGWEREGHVARVMQMGRAGRTLRALAYPRELNYYAPRACVAMISQVFVILIFFFFTSFGF